MSLSAYHVHRMLRRPRAQRVEFDRKRNDSEKCRACYQNGTISIKGKPEIIDALNEFGSVEVTEDDEYTKRICNSCHSFLQAAIQFRKLAQSTDFLLRRPTSESSDEEHVTWLPEDCSVTVKVENCSDSHFNAENNCDDSISGKNRVKNFKKKTPVSKINKEKVVCQVCNKEISADLYPEHLKDRHKANVLPPKPKKKCEICNKIMCLTSYKLHQQTAHSNILNYVCHICGQAFKYQSNYSRHLIDHRGDFPFQCDYCQYRGRCKQLLKLHIRTHTKDYRYKCAECDKKFLTNSNWRKHMLKHKEKTCICDVCSKAFYTRGELNSHIKVDHSGIKDHICNICNKAFGYRSRLMKHQLKVHKREKMRGGRLPLYLLAEQQKQSGQSSEVSQFSGNLQPVFPYTSEDDLQ